MQFINWPFLYENKEALSQRFNAQQPFRYIIIDNFLEADAAELLLAEYPTPDKAVWNTTNYVQQRNKFQKSSFEANSIFQLFFDELNGEKMTNYLSDMTQIQNLMGDEKLFGGGLHQSLRGAFLNVHVDFNKHPETKNYRRLNLLIYLNKDWKPEYEGAIEFWDMERKKKMISVLPAFNRCVIFETNEISFHGHPAPLKTPDGITRKSLAVYYYTKEVPEALTSVSEHNTIFKNTEGLTGYWKSFFSGLKTLRERLLGR